MADTATFTTEIKVRFRDIDAMGHVNNAVIFTYFEEGRKAMFYDHLKNIVPGGFNFIMAHIQCDYLLPVHLEDRLLLSICVTTIGKKSFELAYTLTDASEENRIFAKGSSIQVWYDYRQRRSVPVPQTFRKALLAYHLPS
jgi:acyl-CoA thioester hydrolase